MFIGSLYACDLRHRIFSGHVSFRLPKRPRERNEAENIRNALIVAQLPPPLPCKWPILLVGIEQVVLETTHARAMLLVLIDQ